MFRPLCFSLPIFVFILALGNQSATAQTDWPVYGLNQGATRFSPLKQINTGNIERLNRAWTFHTGKPASEAVPLVINGVMYVAAANGVFALEPETGKQLWHFEATQVAMRGHAYWPGEKKMNPRIFVGTKEGLVAIDATTGKLAAGFGKEGIVDFTQGVLGDMPKARVTLQSPPTIYKNIVITGSNNGEGQPTHGAYGDIRGWDAQTGKLLWTFHTVPRPGEYGYDTWPKDAWKNRSGNNMWGFMTLDEKRGIVYVPLGSPTTDFYGADRHGDGLYGNSLVALDAATGKRIWHQQLVKHDLWDFDLAAPPSLFDLKKDGKAVPAVAMATKMGLLFLFNRVTGEPLFGIKDLPVPASSIPGEKASPTQPFPVKPPPFTKMDIQKEDIYDLSPEHAAFCKDLFEKNEMKMSPMYTPLPLHTNILMFPSTLGGANWGGVSIDPTLGYVFTNVSHVAQWGHMVKKKDPETGEETYSRASSYGQYARFWNRESRIPCSKPPFGELIAVNAATGEIAWRSPLGIVPELEAQGIRNTGALNMGGSVATAGGLLFIAATNDSRIRAFESKTGKLLWEQPIDANGHSSPITYMGKDGRQYVAIMAQNGGGFFGGKTSDALVTFALGDQPAPPPPTISSTKPTSPSPAKPSVKATSTLIDGTGKDITLRACGSTCHQPETFTGLRMDRQSWEAMVQNMIARGAAVKKDEIQIIVDYLTSHYGK